MQEKEMKKLPPCRGESTRRQPFYCGYLEADGKVFKL
jgi:hypothetical protein